MSNKAYNLVQNFLGNWSSDELYAVRTNDSGTEVLCPTVVYNGTTYVCNYTYNEDTNSYRQPTLGITPNLDNAWSVIGGTGGSGVSGIQSISSTTSGTISDLINESSYTDQNGNGYAINNTSSFPITLTATQIFGYDGFTDCTGTSITIPPSAVALVSTVVPNTSYQINSLSSSLQKTYILTTTTSQTIAGLLASQSTAITDAVGNVYVVNNLGTPAINLTTTSTGIFDGFGGFTNCTENSLQIPLGGVAIFTTTALGAGDANDYQINAVSNSSGLTVFSDLSTNQDISDLLDTGNIVDQLGNMYQFINVNTNPINLTGLFLGYSAWANCTSTNITVPGNGSAIITTLTPNTTYSILLNSGVLTYPDTPTFTSVQITDTENFLQVGPTGNSITLTQSATSDWILTLSDGNSVTVKPIVATPGQVVGSIDSAGTQLLTTLPVLPSTSTDFSPIDASGSFLTLTNQGSIYNIIGNMVFVNMNFLYPTNTNTSPASFALDGLPYTYRAESFLISSSTPGIAYQGQLALGSRVITIVDAATGDPITNQDLSGINLLISQLVYASA